MATKKQQVKIRRFLDDIQWLFQINNFEKIIEFSDKPNGDDTGTTALITYDESYQYIKLKVYPSFFDESEQSQLKMLIHECCHCITLNSKHAMLDLLNGKLITDQRITEINEAETSKMENILHGFMTGKYSYAKKACQNYLAQPKTKRKKKK